ncbi:chemotaxis protein CheC [Undibacterium sp. LX40W]|uniref:Chemotaxis protein CheC n=1 Tax=Undibacterium nitidum TaxID=2762298 RepID=A0A923KNK6_9BURK|nr:MULTISPECIES: chemotaxis protein CheC [Undibacterium]MBC3880773.1 chemotaxis protein CheC [Undibacterium nitidum]MBC3890494.1 chemotaxis protein CheC [Undibacterium sp. LX40W]
MNTLSELHLDALVEVFNVGAGRAAASLSEIVGDEVRLSVPSIEIKKSSEADASVLELNSSKFGVVSQNFSGPFEAQALLLFTESHALEIVRDMMGSQMSIEEIAEFEQEAMCELGNIILNACLSAMADMLTISLDSSLPNYKIASVEDIFAGLNQSEDQPYLLLLHIDLAIEKRHSEGHLIFLLSSMSLKNLVIQIERFLGTIE